MNRFRSLLAIFIFVVPLIGTANEDWKTSIEPELALKAIDAFRSNPTGESATAYLSVVVNFAEHSDAVLVTIDNKWFPDEFNTIPSENRPILLGAYIAGNVEKQLKFGITLNSPVEGVQLMLHTYNQLLLSGDMERLPEFDKWVSWNASGSLRAEIED